LHCSAVIALYVHDLEAAGHFLDRTEAHATEHGLAVWHAMATCVRGRWLLNCGKPFNMAAYRKALAELHENGFRMRTIVLVHGAFVDGSGWAGVHRILRDEGFQVIVVQNPTTSLADDVAVTRRKTHAP
jgi:hypothetical protein